MCGRFTQQRPTSELARIFGAEPLVDEPGERYNLAPTQRALVVVEREEKRAITAYRWGLVPSWAKDVSIGSRLINARAETVATTAAFRHAFETRRCIVPADGFYEWRRDGATRQPYYIRRADGLPMAFAGLWASWRDPSIEPGPNGERPDPLRTFTIVTTHANELVAPIHDRMPVVLDERDWATWLETSEVDPGLLRTLLIPAPDGALEAFPVSKLVGNPRSNGPQLIERIELPVA